MSESRYSCMVWYDAAVGDYVAMSPEWGAEAVGVGPSRVAALENLEALVAGLEDAERTNGVLAPRPPMTLAAAVDWVRDHPSEVPAATSWGARLATLRRRRSVTPR